MDLEHEVTIRPFEPAILQCVVFHTILLLSFLEYILQPNPVVVIINPLSQFSLVGENAVLYCHINLTSDSQIKVDWRYNGQVLISDGSNLNSNHISISHYAQENLYTSKLYIQNVSVNDEGYYECLVSDGLYISGKSGSAMVTVSDRALLRIIGESSYSYDNITVKKHEGVPVFLLQMILSSIESGLILSKIMDSMYFCYVEMIL